MKQKYFYEHLIRTEEIIIDLGELDLSAPERLELLSLVEANIHSTVIKLVLSELPEKEKKLFLANLLANDNDKIWIHLWNNTENIEDKIFREVKILIDSLREDIKTAKGSK